MEKIVYDSSIASCLRNGKMLNSQIECVKPKHVHERHLVRWNWKLFINRTLTFGAYNSCDGTSRREKRERANSLTVSLREQRQPYDEILTLSLSHTFYGVGLFICEWIACWQTLFESKIDWHQKWKHVLCSEWVSQRARESERSEPSKP